MNIFFLDHNPSLAAQYHNDKHVVKMILETAQLLSTAHAILDNEGQQVQGMYKPTHKNHPCAIWVRESPRNYDWALSLFENLLSEYTFRYGKIHKCSEKYRFLDEKPKNLPDVLYLTSPALAMPEQYRQMNPVQAYRNYYMGEKRHIAKWSRREVPLWWR